MSENIDLNQLTNLTAQQRAGTQGLLAGQSTASADYLKRYGDLISSQGTTSALAERIGQELGLPALQKNAFQLQQQVYDLPGMQTKAMTGFDISENQRQRVINQKLSELSPLAERATAQQQFAEGQLGTRLGYSQADWARQLQPMQAEQQMLSERMARETTLFSEENSNELSALINKLQMNVQMSEGEKNRMQSLAIQEQNFELEKQKISASQTQGNADTSIIKVGNQQYLIDNATGKIISKYGSAGTGGAPPLTKNTPIPGYWG